MAKWTGKFKTKRTWYGATKFLLEWYDETELGEPFWEELDVGGMHCLELHLTTSRQAIGKLSEALSEANRRKPGIDAAENYLLEKLRSGKYWLAPVDNTEPAPPSETYAQSSPRTAEELAARLSETLKEIAIEFIQQHADWIRQPAEVGLKRLSDCKKRFSEQELEPFDLTKLPPASTLPRP